jgi:hypothetical protein
MCTWYTLAILWLAYANVPVWQLILAAMSAWLAGQIYAFQRYGSVSPLLILSGLLPLTILFPLALIFARLAQRRASAGRWHRDPAGMARGDSVHTKACFN